MISNEWVSRRDYHEKCKWWSRDESFIKANPYNNTFTYKIGDLVEYNGLVYQCVVNIDIPEVFHENKWLSFDDANSSDELVMKRQPSGYFCAKEYSPEYYDNSVVGGAFMVDRATITIRTPDDVEGLKNNCIVEYQDDKWIVVSVQRKNVRNGMTEFAREKNVPHFFIIQMRR